MNPLFFLVMVFMTNVITAQVCYRDGQNYMDGASWLDDAICKRLTCTAGVVKEEATGCPYKGECMPFDTNRANFTTCKIVKCARSDSGYRLTNSANGCIDQIGICHPIDSEWTVDRCFVKTCEFVSEGIVQEKLVSAGCPYDGNTCLSIGERRKSSLCIEYECQLNGLQYGVKLVSGGCEDNGTCRDEGTRWTKDCIQYECKRINDGFKTEPITKDCSFNSACKKDGTTWMDGCFKYQCSNGLFHLLSGECLGRDGCHPVGSEWVEDSFTYTCIKNGNSYAKVAAKDERGVIKGGCSFNGATRSVGEVWDEGCFKKTCNRYNNTFRTEVVSGQCQHDNGSCIPVGTILEDNCFTYQCKETGMKYTAELIDIKCRSTENGKDVCLKNGESSYVSGCSSKVCTVDMATKKWKLGVQAECVFNTGSEKKCIPKNEFGVNNKCIKYKCQITQKGKQTRAQMKKVEATGCLIRGSQQLKTLGDNKLVPNNHCAQLGDTFTDKKCRIWKCTGNKRTQKLRRNGKSKDC